MKLQYQEYQARKIVNVHRHADSWFWDKYSAHPYIGCRSGCEFCYLRGGYYLGKRLPESFDTLIQVKMNAVELLRKELRRLPKDVLACGDWQEPAEKHYQLSRQMLRVVYELGFPLHIIERSSLVVRDIDLLCEIHRRARAGVILSLSSLDEGHKQIFEPHSPGIKNRLKAMELLAKDGILVGAALMPVLPYLGDDQGHLEEVVKAVKGQGGSFLLVGGLSMAGIQAERSLQAVRKMGVELEAKWRKLYNWKPEGEPAYSPSRAYTSALGIKVREICDRYGISDRMPRYIPENEFGINKRIAELLFNKTYELEINQADQRRIWAYRKAAWTVDELSQSLAEIYRSGGVSGLTALPDIGSAIAAEIKRMLEDPTINKKALSRTEGADVAQQ